MIAINDEDHAMAIEVANRKTLLCKKIWTLSKRNWLSYRVQKLHHIKLKEL